jgi:hypothetical protein
MNVPNCLVTFESLAAALGTSVSSIRRLIKEPGTVQPLRLGRRRMFRLDELVEVLPEEAIKRLVYWEIVDKKRSSDDPDLEFETSPDDQGQSESPKRLLH